MARTAYGALGRPFPTIGQHQFDCSEPGQNGGQMLRRAFLQFHSAGRDIAGGDPGNPAHLAGGGQHIGPARLQQGFLGQRAGRDETHDVARDQRLRTAALLCFRRRFHLFGNGDPATGLYEASQIAFCRMDRHAAHRDGDPIVFTTRRECNVENLACDLCIIEKQLKEVSHPVEQQAIARFLAQSEILSHHRGCAGIHGCQR